MDTIIQSENVKAPSFLTARAAAGGPCGTDLNPTREAANAIWSREQLCCKNESIVSNLVTWSI